MLADKRYAPQDVRKLLKISYRQIQYWDDSGFIQPSVKRNGFRFYTIFDIVLLGLAIYLRNKIGYSIQQLRKVVPNLRKNLREVKRSKRLLDLLVVVWRDHAPCLIAGEVYGELPEDLCTIVTIRKALDLEQPEDASD